jgi:transposase
MLDWPGNSPDINHIENMWSIMKKRLGNERGKSVVPRQWSEKHLL